MRAFQASEVLRTMKSLILRGGLLPQRAMKTSIRPYSPPRSAWRRRQPRDCNAQRCAAKEGRIGST